MPPPYNQWMTDKATPSTTQKLMSYWWAPLTVLAVVLAVLAYLRPYQELEVADVSPSVIDSLNTLDKSFGTPVKNSYKYSTRRTYSSPNGPIEVEIRMKLSPLGGGLVMRQDDWYDLKDKNIVYQERFILFRNIFSLYRRSREVAPLVHDLMGRVGWYNDTLQSLESEVKGGQAESPSWAMDVTTERLSETEGKGLTRQTTPYQRRLHCERTGEVEGSAIGSTFKGSYPKISCRIVASDQPGERLTNYAYLPDQGIFLLLGYQQSAEKTEKVEVTGSYVSFEVVP